MTSVENVLRIGGASAAESCTIMNNRAFTFAGAVPPPENADCWWFMDHWGTSSDASNVSLLETGCVKFRTAWWPPLEWVERVSAQFVDVQFDLYWADNALQTACGHYTTRAGKTTHRAFREDGPQCRQFLETHFPRRKPLTKASL